MPAWHAVHLNNPEEGMTPVCQEAIADVQIKGGFTWRGEGAGTGAGALDRRPEEHSPHGRPLVCRQGARHQAVAVAGAD